VSEGRLLCPRCGSTNHQRLDSRRFRAKRLADANVVARPHRCQDCRKEWVSIETPLLSRVAELIMSLLDDAA
jgi:transcriptional regulator NrdR family protein